MLTKKPLLLAAVVVAIGTLFAATMLRAHIPTGVPVTEPGPFVCDTRPNLNWRIEAQLGSSGEFPKAMSCSSNHPGQQCGEYDYKITSLKGLNVDHTVVAISADQDLDSVTSAGNSTIVVPPGVGDSSTGFLANAYHEYVITVNASGFKNVLLNIGIVAPTAPRITTVLVKKGNTTEACSIAGPGVLPSDPNEAVTTDSLEQAGPCTLTVRRGLNGKIIAVTTTTPGCAPADTVDAQSLSVNLGNESKGVLFLGPGDIKFTLEGSCTYMTCSGGKCYPVTCATCIIKNGVCSLP